VCILPEKAIPKMTYTVSGGTLNPTHSLTYSLTHQSNSMAEYHIYYEFGIYHRGELCTQYSFEAV